MNEITIPGIELKRRGNLLIGSCPNHVDNTPSFTVYPDGHFHCYSCNYHGWVDDLTGKKERVRTKEGIKDRQKKIWPTIDWTPFREAFDLTHALRLCKWRGYHCNFIATMKNSNWIGIFEDQFCFPITQEGRIVRAHVRLHETSKAKRNWFYYPVPGASATAFVISQKPSPIVAHIFESQWDMFALMSQLSPFLLRHSMFVATRGAANFNKLGHLQFPNSCYVWPQNDEAGERWKEGVEAYLKTPTLTTIQVPNKDANDYLKDGGDLTKLIV